ncbi:acyl-CoA dehydrogenase [Nocardioides humi]|uniref:Acyl-CoA dehydrogenase n=1 Tax=Nocardioides humi TaxID=449461 RepID=A0ABN2AHP9_9ACTN|nr:acyl-CoA dehydrogenase [Nocardioides humi]
MSDVLSCPLDLGVDAADLASAVRRWLERACPPEVVRAALTERSADASWRPPLRHGLVQLGLPGLAVPEAYGGSGAGVVELAAVAEQLGRVLCPVPHLSSAVLATLPLVLTGGSAAGELLTELAAGERTAAVASGPEPWSSPLVATREDTGWFVDGAAPAVLDATTADRLLAVATTPHGPGLFLVEDRADGRVAGGETPMDLTLDVAPVVLRRAAARPVAVPGPGDREEPDGVAQRLRTAHHLAALVLAGEQVGGAARILELTVEHARVRHQFGRAIGSFQAVKHRCADLLMTLESMRSVVRDGLLRCASVLDGGPIDHDAVALAADLARSVAADGYLRIATAVIQLHGGIGFTWEHDAHLYLKRARATQLLLGGPGRSRERLLPLLLADAARTGSETGVATDTTPVPPAVAAFLARHPVASTPDRDLRAARYDAGLAEQGEVEAAFLAAGARDWSGRNVIGLGMAMATIRAHGNPEQQEAHLRPCFTGEHIWCQLFSEPGAGSDLAGLATRAVADGDDFVVTGQKVWTSLGHVADYGLLLARTDPDVPKHRGLTYFLLDMRLPGIEVRPLRQLTGEAEFNEVRFDGVRVPRSAVLGAVGDGWRVAMTTLMNERVAIGGSRAPRHGGPIATALASYRRAVARGVAGPIEGDRLVRLWSAAEAARLTSARSAAGGGDPGPQGSIAKLQMAEGNQASYDFCVELAAAEGLYVDDYDQGDGATSAVFGSTDPRKAWLRSLANSIEGGTSEVLRNVLGERVLGLPGEPRVDRDVPWSRTQRS